MGKQSGGPLKQFLAANAVSQAELARGTGLTTGYVSLLANDRAGASQATIAAILSSLAARIGRRVTYEEVFGPSTSSDSGRVA